MVKWRSQSTRFRSMNVGGDFSGFSGLSDCGKKPLLADLVALGASSIRREGRQATYAADEQEGKEREGKGREGKERKGKGREGKGIS